MSTGLFADEEEGYNLEEDSTKYKLKIPVEKSDEDDFESDDTSFDDFESDNSDDKPFDDTPFDAGIEADEDEDPEKYLQQLAGKIGTSLRSYTDKVGDPDLELEKFVINSVLSATHTAQMEEDDQDDIISRIKTSGKDIDTSDDEVDSDENLEVDDEEVTDDEISDLEKELEGLEESTDSMFGNDENFGEDENFTNDDTMWNEELSIYEDENPELENEMFFSDVYSIFESISNILEKDFEELNNIINDNHDWVVEHLTNIKVNLQNVYQKLSFKDNLNEKEENYTFHQNLEIIQKLTFDILNLDIENVDTIVSNEDWMSNLVAKSVTHAKDVYNFLFTKTNDSMKLNSDVKVSDDLKHHLDNEISLSESVFRYGSEKHIKLLKEVKKLDNFNLISLNETDKYIIENLDGSVVKIKDEIIPLNFILENNSKDKYSGKKSNSPMRDSSGGKAYKVYVPGCSAKTENNPRGIKVVRFGSGGLKAKLSDSEARKNYDARHGCSDGKHNDKCKAGYWSCRLPKHAEKLGIKNAGGNWW